MIDVIGTHVFIVGLFPAKGKLVADTIRKCLGFSKSRTTKEKKKITTLYNVK